MRPSRSRWRVTALACAALTAMASSTAFAQPVDSSSVMNRPRVDLVLAAASPQEADAFERTLRELLGRIGVDLTTTRTPHIDDRTPIPPPGAPPTSRAYAAVDLAGEEGVRGIVVDGESRALVLRRTIRRDGSVAIAAEEMAHVVYSSIDALLDPAQKRPDPPKEAAPPTTTEPALLVTSETPHDTIADHATHTGAALDVNAFGVARYMGAGLGPEPGGGVALGLAASRARWAPEIWIAGALQAPFETANPDASVRTSLVSARLYATFAIAQSGRLRFDLGLGGGVDVASITSRAVDPNAKVPGDQTATSVPLTGLASMSLRIVSRVDLTLSGGTDIDMAPTRYTIRHDDRASELFASSRVRPFAMLGLSFRALGDTRAPGGSQ